MTLPEKKRGESKGEKAHSPPKDAHKKSERKTRPRKTFIKTARETIAPERRARSCKKKERGPEWIDIDEGSKEKAKSQTRPRKTRVKPKKAKLAPRKDTHEKKRAKSQTRPRKTRMKPAASLRSNVICGLSDYFCCIRQFLVK